MALTLYYLDNSRAFRVLWAAYELGLKDRVVVKKFARVEGKKAVPEMAKDSGFALGKSPYLVDENGSQRVEVFESVACIQYLVDRYGTESPLLPRQDWPVRARIQSWMSFCETTMLHSLAIVYARWFTPESAGDVLGALEDKMSANVCKDLDLMEEALRHNRQQFGESHGFLAGGHFSMADVANAFSAEYVIAKQVGTAGRKWPGIERWLKTIEARPAYQEALGDAGLHEISLLNLEEDGKI
ncbi:unnamed protein product [Parajaminaea phylloscopi]